MKAWDTWRDKVVDQVRFWPDRAAIAKELDAHYEDHVKDLERIGFEYELAQERALNAMGDAEEVGRAMDKSHKPGLGWLWLVSKWAAILCIVTVALMFFGNSGWQQSFHEPAQRSGDYEPDGYSYFSEGWERDNAVRVLIGKGASTVERDGDAFSVPYAAVWKCHYPADGVNSQSYDLYWLTVILAADDKNPFDTTLTGVREGDYNLRFPVVEDGREGLHVNASLAALRLYDEGGNLLEENIYEPKDLFEEG